MTSSAKIEEARKKYNEKIKLILPKRCVLNTSKCSLNSDKKRISNLTEYQPYSFVMRPYAPDCLDMELACKKIIQTNFYIAHNAVPEAENNPPSRNEMATILAKDESFIGNGFCQICSMCLYSYFGVAELGHLNPNVLLEIGLMIAFGKPIIFTLDKRITSIKEVPFDINGILLISYQNIKELESGLKAKISAVLQELKHTNLL